MQKSIEKGINECKYKMLNTKLQIPIRWNPDLTFILKTPNPTNSIK